MSVRSLLLAFGIAAFFVACTPKVSEKTVVDGSTIAVAPPPPKAADESLSPCAKFSDAPNSDEASTNYVLYRDFLKVGDWDKSFELWKKVYDVAPAADGRRNTVYSDGIRFYEHYMAQTTDSLKREGYINRIFGIYEEVDKCYPEGSYVVARKAFDYYYKYKNRVSNEEIYQMFKQAIDAEGVDTPDFVLNPFTALLVEQYFSDKISVEEAQKYQQMIREILAEGQKDCKGVACERWAIIESYAPARLEAFETVKGFYDCNYYLDKYYADFLAAQDDCDVIRTVYSRLVWGGCPEDNEQFKVLIAAGNANCRTEPGPITSAYECLRNADYQCAITKFQEAADNTEDMEKKGTYILLIAKIYQVHLKDFSVSRDYALQASEIRPDWGDPYMHMGRLYASSGPLCGPGRGWDSQVVVWPAVDMWSKAKSVDPSVTGEANKWINQYSQYMPSREDIFQRNLKEGDTFRVGCWIQRSTRIRAAK